LHINLGGASFATWSIFLAGFAGDTLRRGEVLPYSKLDGELLKEKRTVILNFRKIHRDLVIDTL